MPWVERVASRQRQRRGDERFFGLVPDRPVLKTPRDERLALLSEPEKTAAQVLPLLPAPFRVDGPQCLRLCVAENAVCVPIPPGRDPFDPGGRKRADVVEQPVDRRLPGARSISVSVFSHAQSVGE